MHRVNILAPVYFGEVFFEGSATAVCDLYQRVAQHQMEEKIVQALQIKREWLWWKNMRKTFAKAQPPFPLS